MLKKVKKKERPKSLQEIGAATQKAAVTDRITRRLKDLREAMAAGTVHGPFSKGFVLRWIKVDKNTLKCSYHAELAKEVQKFLLEADRACDVTDRKPKKSKKRSMRQQMADLAEEAEAVRLRMQCQIDDLMDRLHPKGKARRPDPKNFRSTVRIGTSRGRAIAASSARTA